MTPTPTVSSRPYAEEGVPPSSTSGAIGGVASNSGLSAAPTSDPPSSDSEEGASPYNGPYGGVGDASGFQPKSSIYLAGSHQEVRDLPLI